MDQKLEKEIKFMIKQSKRKKIWAKVLSVTMCLVVFCTTYALILPAISMETDTFCGIEAHTHTDECYEQTLICQIHEHTDACYLEQSQLICTLPESEGHTHTDACVSQTETVLNCDQEESQGHTHTEACTQIEQIISCGQEESQGHSHSEQCSSMTLTCTLAEDDTHSHSDSCYSIEWICGQEESQGHTHTDDCYTTAVTYVCGQEEVPGHTHTDACYTAAVIYGCGQEEAQPHTHSDECYEVTQVQTCTWETDPDHEHTESCYDKHLICQQEAHEHSLSCYSDPSADLETAATWEASLPDQLSGEYAADVLAIAKSQVGYTESTKNYIVSESGEIKGYTRYGDWYGIPYGDWCAMFVSFCLDYAGVEEIPLNASCPDWINVLKEKDMYESAAGYTPMAGDIIFFDWNDDGSADHVGLVAEYIPATEHTAERIQTIEGNSDDTVRYVSYNLADPTIMGYGLLPMLEEDSAEAYSAINVSGTLMYHHPDYLEYQYSSHRVNEFMTLTYVLVPYENRETWRPNTVQWSANANANYVVAYCADRDTKVSTTGETYTAYAIEEISYYSDYARALSGIVGHSYPFITAEEMRAELAAAYEAGEITIDLSCCVESEYIAAAQWAIWDATGLSGLQTTASQSTFPSYNAVALNPLSDVGHTDAATIQSHVQAIRDWLFTQRASENLGIARHESQVIRNEDGTYNVETVVSLDRALEDNEVIYGNFSAGEHTTDFTIEETGLSEFTVFFSGLTAEEVLSAKVDLEVHVEHMQVYVYDSGSYQDMISGQWGENVYSLSFEVDVETTSVDVTKSWADGESGAEYVEVQLYADGEQSGPAQKLSAENGWTYTWDELLKYSGAGAEIEYTVKEIPIPGYYSSITMSDNGSRIITTAAAVAGFEEDGAYVFTSGSNALADVSGSLEWVEVADIASSAGSVPQNAVWTATGVSSDGTNAYLQNNATGNYLSFDGSNYIILDSGATTKVFFQWNLLYVADASYCSHLLTGVSGGVGNTTTDWNSAMGVNLYKYTQVENLTADISFLITNTKTTELTSVSVIKEWAGRSDGKYPDSVEVNLLQDGIPYGESVTLSQENGWYYLWEDLPLRLNDTFFTYSVEEVQIKDYTTTLQAESDTDGTLLFRLCNTWSPEYVPLVLSKTDLNNPDKLLPGARFQLYAAVGESDTDAVVIPGTENTCGILLQDITIGEDGLFRIEELLVGETHYLVEVAAPNGYNALDGPVVFIARKDAQGQVVLAVLSDESWASANGTNAEGDLLLQIRNQEMYILPETGGTGTYLYTTMGLLLMAVAAAILLYNHKSRRKEDPSSS